MAIKPMESEQQATSELISEKTSAIDLRRRRRQQQQKRLYYLQSRAGASTIDEAGVILIAGKDLITTYFVDST
jgi:hypothetical protein